MNQPSVFVFENGTSIRGDEVKADKSFAALVEPKIKGNWEKLVLNTGLPTMSSFMNLQAEQICEELVHHSIIHANHEQIILDIQVFFFEIYHIFKTQM